MRAEPEHRSLWGEQHGGWGWGGRQGEAANTQLSRHPSQGTCSTLLGVPKPLTFSNVTLLVFAVSCHRTKRTRHIGSGWEHRARWPRVGGQSLRRGLSCGRVSAGADERLTPGTLWPRAPQSGSVLAARLRACSLTAGEGMLREMTLLGRSQALGAEELGWGIRGPHFPVVTGKQPGGKRGQGAAS